MRAIIESIEKLVSKLEIEIECAPDTDKVLALLLSLELRSEEFARAIADAKAIADQLAEARWDRSQTLACNPENDDTDDVAAIRGTEERFAALFGL